MARLWIFSAATLLFSSLVLPVASANNLTAGTDYVLRCSGCHGTDGSGHEAAGIPDFRNQVGVFAEDNEGRTYLLHVPGVVNSSLDNDRIAAVLNYIMRTWAGASLKMALQNFTSQEVAARREQVVSDVVAMRRQISLRLLREGIKTANYPWP